MKLAKTYGYLRKDLQSIEDALHDSIQANHEVLRKTSSQLLKAGGKRIRPVFVLLSGQLGSNYDKEQVKTAAVALELIHMATLVHDDVVDNSELRRGKPTIKHIYGDQIAMYTGDYILAKALENILQIRNPKVHQLLSKTIVEVCIGEIEQIEQKFNWDQQLRDYLRRIKRKTALLIATSCKLGAIVSDATERQAHHLYKYGYYIGMSFQIIDDILDFTASVKELGKPTGGDLIQGHITLPILIAKKDPAFDELLRKTFTDPTNVTEEQLDYILTALHQTNAIEKAYEMSEKYLQKALEALDILPDYKAKKILIDIAKAIGKRRS